MSKSGFTLAEVLAVISILAVLGAIGYSVSAPAREQSRQGVCINQLKQIYSAVALYSADYEPQYQELHGLSYIGFENKSTADVLKAYGFTSELLFCPSSSVRMKEHLASSYLWPIHSKPIDELGGPTRARQEMIRLEEILGSALPIVQCHIHDELFYAPSEQHIDPKMATPFRILLRVDGSVRRGRTYPPRTSVFSDLAYQSR